MKKETAAIVIFALVVIGIWGWLEFRSQDSRKSFETASAATAAALSKGHNVLGATNVIQRDWSSLEGMQWPDVSPTAAFLASNGLLAERFIEETTEIENPPARYLRGMVQMGREKLPEALKEFQKIPIAEIPAIFLYAPWRLQSALDSTEPTSGNAGNAFAAPLFAAADAAELPPLLTARTLMAREKFREALESYLRANPAEWASIDLENFRILMLDEAYRVDAGTILLGAMRANTVPAALRQSVANLLLGRTNAFEPTPAAVRDFLEKNPEAMALAEQAIRSLLEDRALFVQEKFADLVAKHTSSKEADQIDESVILLTIASSAISDQPAFFRWSQELSRRFPEPDVTAWIESLKNP